MSSAGTYIHAHIHTCVKAVTDTNVFMCVYAYIQASSQGDV